MPGRIPSRPVPGARSPTLSTAPTCGARLMAVQWLEGTLPESLEQIPIAVDSVAAAQTDLRIQDMYCRECQIKRSTFERSTKCTMTVNTAATTNAVPIEFPCSRTVK